MVINLITQLIINNMKHDPVFLNASGEQKLEHMDCQQFGHMMLTERQY
jgi:hypothetical protein